MRLFADENIPSHVVGELRNDGHEVAHVYEEAPGLSDLDVLERAEASSAMLLTQDKDFGFFAFRQQRLPGGVILLRLVGAGASEKASVLRAVIREHGETLLGHFVVVTHNRVRIRPQS